MFLKVPTIRIKPRRCDCISNHTAHATSIRHTYGPNRRGGSSSGNIQRHLKKNKPPTRCRAARLFSASSFHGDTLPPPETRNFGGGKSFFDWGPFQRPLATSQKCLFSPSYRVPTRRPEGSCLCELSELLQEAGRDRVFYKFLSRGRLASSEDLI